MIGFVKFYERNAFMKKALTIFATLFWCLLLLVGFMVYGSSGHDDPHINFWFSHTLLEYGQMVNYNGDRVEQTTSLLLVFLVALLNLVLPFDLVTCGYLVDIFSAFACCVLVSSVAKKLVPAFAMWPALLMLASVSFMLWAFGGMGAVLAAFSVLAAATVWWLFVEAPQLHKKYWLTLLAVTLMLVLVRPEMPLVLVLCATFLLLMHANDRKRRRRFLYILLIGLSASLLLFVWQKWYFSSWLPLPVIAKQAGSRSLLAKLDIGFFYLAITSLSNPVILLSIFATPLVFWQFFKKLLGGAIESEGADACPQSVMTLLLILVSFFGAYCGFVWASGGDWMQGGRFLVPVIPVASLLLVIVFSLWVRQRWIMQWLLVLLVIFSVAPIPLFVARESHGIPVWVKYRLQPDHAHYSAFEKYNQEHLRDMAVIDHLQQMIPVLHQRLERPVRLLSGQAGMVFYTLGKELYGQVEFSDLRGLVEGSYTTCPFLLHVSRNAMGLSWNYTQYFSMQPLLKLNCNIDPPDVIYDLNDHFQDMVSVFNQAGYSLVHREKGFVVFNDTGIPANSLYVPNLVFVRNDLLPVLGNPDETVINYQNMPLRSRY